MSKTDYSDSNEQGDVDINVATWQLKEPRITHRQWLAGLAMQGLLSSMGPDAVLDRHEYASVAYRMADAMLAAETSQQEENQE